MWATLILVTRPYSILDRQLGVAFPFGRFSAEVSAAVDVDGRSGHVLANGTRDDGDQLSDPLA
jgi:hypothetical protein